MFIRYYTQVQQAKQLNTDTTETETHGDLPHSDWTGTLTSGLAQVQLELNRLVGRVYQQQQPVLSHQHNWNKAIHFLNCKVAPKLRSFTLYKNRQNQGNIFSCIAGKGLFRVIEENWKNDYRGTFTLGLVQGRYTGAFCTDLILIISLKKMKLGLTIPIKWHNPDKHVLANITGCQYSFIRLTFYLCDINTLLLHARRSQ